MRPLRYSINVSLDGSIDHTAMMVDEEMHTYHTRSLERADGMLMGRVMYQMMEEGWRHPVPAGSRPEWMEPFADVMQRTKKYVVSNTLHSLDWNAELLRGDLRESIERLKAEPGRGLLLSGVTLALTLADMGLIDEYDLVVHPRLVGHGPRLFEALAKPIDLELVERTEFTSGTVAMKYVPRR